MNIHSSFIHNNPNYYVLQGVSNIVYLFYGKLLGNKKEQTLDIHDNLDKSLGNYAE